LYNPRLDYLVRSALKGDRSDKKLHDLLWSRNSVKELAKSIHQNGGLIVPIVVIQDGTVVEVDQKGFKEAYEVLVKDRPAMRSDLFASVEAATEALKAAPFDEIQDIQNGNVQKIVMLRNLHRAIQDIATVAKVQI
jgi:hypothetical protein